jgi:exo-beta-1,3-glucanase (GH17 family)
VNPIPSNPTFVQIPNITVSALGQKITPVDLSLYVEGGTAPFTFTVTAQTLSDNVVSSISGVQLVSDYSYYAGTNTVTVSVTDANQKSAQTTVNLIVTIPQVTHQVFGIDVSPYVGAQNPNDGTVIDDDQLIQQIGAITPYTTAIRSFGCTSGLEDVARIAKKFGLKVFVGIWIGTDPTANNTELQNCISVAQTVQVDAAIIGSEALLRNDVTPAQLIAYITQFRSAVPGVPVTTADQYLPLENNPAVVAVCDFVFANYYPFWEGADISTAIASLNAEDALLRATYAPKKVIVSETGWQSFGNAVGNAVPSPENAALYFLNFESWAQAGQRETFYFEDHDEPWKGTDDGWGIWDQNLVMKSGMIDVFNGVTMADNWTCKAVPGGSGTPLLQFTTVPPIGSSNPLKGQEWHAIPSNYYVVVYIHVGSYGWWVKPYADSPFTTIACDGSWTTNVDTGGSDSSADQIVGFLIPTTYTPPTLLGAASLPPELYSNSVANATATR